MARTLWLEPIGGIAGDMFLAAALDAGVDRLALESTLRSLKVPHWDLKVSRVERHALQATHVEVVVREPETGHVHRSFSDIVTLITDSNLGPNAKRRAVDVFRNLGEVEAAIHGTTLEAIHFHEVGAIDSIVDICGACVALELMGDPAVFSAPPPMGSGTIRIAHGVVPVPVPATLALVKGMPVSFEGKGELTTPTGAALLKTFATVAPPPALRPERVGYGAGTKDLPDRANLLRLTLGESLEVDATEQLTVLECNLDDATPQLLAAVVELAIAEGALDAWVVPAVMKKGRPAHVVSVLCASAQRASLVELLFRESTTLGLREYQVSRTALERRFETVQTEFGEVTVKVGLREGRVINAAPEFDECRARAETAKVGIKEVQAAAMAAWRAR